MSRKEDQKRKKRTIAKQQKIRRLREEGRADRRANNKIKRWNKPLKKMTDEEIKAKLQHNMEILKALQDEYEADQQRRKEVNEKLEAEGHKTLKEKMDHINEVAQNLVAQQGLQIETGLQEKN